MGGKKMENITDWLYHHKTLLIALIIILIGSISSVFAFTYEEPLEENQTIGDSSSNILEKTEENIKELEEARETSQESSLIWSIDIKGQINHPGVYQIKEGTRIHEIIELAGGLKENATTENINLSKKASDEMVIYIFSKEEYMKQDLCNIKKKSEIEITEEIQKKKSLIEKEEKENSDVKISINNGTKEELMTLEGIGEAKAENIIKYREEHGLFKELEELKEISGIGESIYSKIKDKIKL